MALTIRNLTSRPVIVPLNSGHNLRLSPGELAGNIENVDVKDNLRIEKLRGQRAIEVEAQTEGTREKATGEFADSEAAESTGAEGEARPRARKKS